MLPKGKMKLLLALICFSAFNCFSYGQNGSIKGNVLDSTSNESIIFADVILKGTSYHTKTDINGDFYIDSLPAGKYELQIKYVGFELLEKEVSVTKNRATEMSVHLKVRTIMLSDDPLLQYQEPLIDPGSADRAGTVTREEFSRGDVYGFVYSDFPLNQPLVGASVSLVGTKFKCVSLSSPYSKGFYSMDSVPPGEYTIRVDMPGKISQIRKFTLESYFSTWFYLPPAPFRDSTAYNEIISKLSVLKKDTILVDYTETNNCTTGDTVSSYYETGDLKHLKKYGEWVGYWGNGNICYEAKYKQTLKFKKVSVYKKTRGKKTKFDYDYGKQVMHQRFRLRHWIIPVDTLVAYNYEGKPVMTIHFSEKGKILDTAINMYDEVGRLRYTQNVRTGKFKEYCEDGFVIDSTNFNHQQQYDDNDNPISAHFLECTKNCFVRFDWSPQVPFEESIIKRIKAKF